MKKNINEEIERIKDVMGLNEDVAVNSLDDFPEDLKKIFLNNYLHLISKFDWNRENERFTNRATGEYDGAGFKKWMEEEEKRQFEKSKRKIMAAVFEDMLNLKKKLFFRKKAEEFENELKDLFGFHIMGNDEEAGEHISGSVFRKFIEERPKYKKYYDTWVRLEDEETKYLLKDYHSAVNVPSYVEIRKIYNFLKTGKTI